MITVINPGSKSVSNIVKIFFQRNSQKYEKIQMLDYFPSYTNYSTAFTISKHNEDKNKFKYDQILNQTQVLRLLKESKHLLYFTHGYFQNATCKNVLLKNISDLASQCQNLEKVVFLNSNELSQTNEGRDYFLKATEIEEGIINKLPNSNVLWYDITEGGYTDFLQGLGSMYKTDKSHFLRFVSNEKISQGIEKLMFENHKFGKFYLQKDLEIKLDDLQKQMGIKDHSYFDYSKNNLITETLKTSCFRNNLRRLLEPVNLSDLLHDYHILNIENIDKFNLQDLPKPTPQQSLLKTLFYE